MGHQGDGLEVSYMDRNKEIRILCESILLILGPHNVDN